MGIITIPRVVVGNVFSGGHRQYGGSFGGTTRCTGIHLQYPGRPPRRDKQRRGNIPTKRLMISSGDAPEPLLSCSSFEGEGRPSRPLDANIVVCGGIQGVLFLAGVLEVLEECVTSVLVLGDTVLGEGRRAMRFRKRARVTKQNE